MGSAVLTPADCSIRISFYGLAEFEAAVNTFSTDAIFPGIRFVTIFLGFAWNILLAALTSI